MKRFVSVLVLFFLTSSFVFAQNELYVISKKDEKVRGRISKGTYLRITSTDGERYSGTLVKVEAYSIVLMNRRASIDVDLEEIKNLRIETTPGSGSGILISTGSSTSKVQGSYFRSRDWHFFVKEG